MSDPPFDYDDVPPLDPAHADAPAPPAAGDVTEMRFEDALAELERIVLDLERGELELDDAIDAYERGTALRRHCEAKLKEARLRVERITLGPADDPRAEPMDLG